MTHDAPVSNSGIGDMLISSRSFAEYRSMFALTDDDLSRRILDCPAGAAGFTSAVNDRGGDVLGPDIDRGEGGERRLNVSRSSGMTL